MLGITVKSHNAGFNASNSPWFIVHNSLLQVCSVTPEIQCISLIVYIYNLKKFKLLVEEFVSVV